MVVLPGGNVIVWCHWLVIGTLSEKPGREIVMLVAFGFASNADDASTVTFAFDVLSSVIDGCADSAQRRVPPLPSHSGSGYEKPLHCSVLPSTTSALFFTASAPSVRS